MQAYCYQTLPYTVNDLFRMRYATDLGSVLPENTPGFEKQTNRKRESKHLGLRFEEASSFDGNLHIAYENFTRLIQTFFFLCGKTFPSNPIISESK